MTIKNIMQLSKAQLEEAAEKFNVGGETKKEIIDALSEREVSLADVKKALGLNDRSEQPTEVVEDKDSQKVFQEGSEKVFVKMERGNPTYTVGHWSFTKVHPFQIMTRVEAKMFLSQEEGFRLATQEEVSSYYN